MNLHQRFVRFCTVKRMLINLTGVMFAVTQLMWAQSPQHPLDGLTAPEIWTAYQVLQASTKVDAKTRYPMVQLKEPPKEVEPSPNVADSESAQDARNADHSVR